MKEKLLVLAKACPETSQKYESLVCVAGITDKGEWRRIYPVPWAIFWKNSGKNFPKKFWIEYELAGEKPSDYRPESRKIKFDTIRVLREAPFSEIEGLLKPKITTIEQLEALGPKKASIGVICPSKLIDFPPVTNQQYEKLVTMGGQKDLFGESALKLDIPKYKYQYIFMDDSEGRKHSLLCEDWEVGELYRNCEKYRKMGKYSGEAEVHRKIREKMLEDIPSKGPVYFIVGTHFRFPTFMIVGVVYQKKADFAKN